MKITHNLGLALVVGALAAMTSGCFATRVVRTDTTTPLAMIEAPNAQPPALAAIPASGANAPVVVATGVPAGTLVVEALVPPPPASSAHPVRLPDAVAAAYDPPRHTRVASSTAPAWDPLPSYVGQFTGAGWLHRPIFGASAQTSTGFRSWGGGGRALSGGFVTAPGAYGSASPHFSSAPSYGGGISAHFAGGYPASGF